MDDDTTRVRLQLRVPAYLKFRLEQYAEQLGVPVNTAVILLLNEALPAAHRAAERRGQS